VTHGVCATQAMEQEFVEEDDGEEDDEPEAGDEEGDWDEGEEGEPSAGRAGPSRRGRAAAPDADEVTIADTGDNPRDEDGEVRGCGAGVSVRLCGWGVRTVQLAWVGRAGVLLLLARLLTWSLGWATGGGGGAQR
jgi:hypothetical protein